MAEDLVLVAAANTLSIFAHGDARWFIEYEKGWGMPPLKHITTQGIYQDGETWLDMRILPRLLTYRLRYHGSSRSNMYDGQRELSKWLAAFGEFKLRKTLPDGQMRQLDCNFLDGNSFEADGGRNLAALVESVRFIAHDPIIYDPTAKEFVLASYQVSGDWKFDAATSTLAFPATFSGLVLGQTGTLNYAGSYKSYPIITISGPIGDPIIHNLTTAEKLDFTGHTVDDGKTLVIDCRYGYKTVTHSTQGNVRSWLSTDSDLATFHIRAMTAAHGGENDIKLEGSGGGVNTRVVFTYYERYISI